jgi:hypothetical protein
LDEDADDGALLGAGEVSADGGGLAVLEGEHAGDGGGAGGAVVMLAELGVVADGPGAQLQLLGEFAATGGRGR